MSTIAQSTQRTTITTPAVNPDPNALSIRQIMLRGILAGTPKNEIHAAVTAAYPGSAADLKFAKHYAWYKAWLKKNPATTETQSA